MLPLDCGSLGLPALQACQAQCQGDGGAGSCQQCSQQKCQPALGACISDMAAGGCAAWLNCAGVCYQTNPPDPTCFAACDAQFPNATAKYHAIYNCACASCNAECLSSGVCGIPDAGADATPDADTDAEAGP